MSGLSRGELEFLSLLNYIKEGILARSYSQEVVNEPLVYDTSKGPDNAVRTDYKIVDPNASTYGVVPTAEGRGWLSFELNEINACSIYNVTTSSYVPTYNTPFMNQSFTFPTEREKTLIKVYDQNGDELNRSWYQIDYKNGRIRYPAPMDPLNPEYPAYSGAVSSGITPTSIDYRFHLVSCLDGWPTDDRIPEVPFLAIYPVTEYVDGFQIGPGVENSRTFCIDIFANSNSNKRALVDLIKQGLFNKHAPVIDFNRTGQPLTHWGNLNPNFIKEFDFNGSTYKSYLTLNPGNGNILYFVDVEVLYDTSPRVSMSNSMRHMAKIKFKTCTFSDRDPEMVGKFAGLEEPPTGFDSLIKKAYTA